jgi:hypothetical protein
VVALQAALTRRSAFLGDRRSGVRWPVVALGAQFMSGYGRRRRVAGRVGLPTQWDGILGR